MKSEELNKIGEWLNTRGYGIDLSDDFWMEEYEWGEHKTRDICQMLFDYHAEQCNIPDVVGRSEQLCPCYCDMWLEPNEKGEIFCSCGKKV